MRKKTTNQKQLTGTHRPDKTPAAAKPKTNRIPPAQKFLDKDARKIYRQICQHLLDNSALSKIDSFYISMAAQSFADYSKFAIQARQNGYIQKYESGATNISTEYVIMQKERDAIERYCKNLGLNTKARDGLLAFAAEVENNQDPFTLLMQKKTQLKKVV
jgi:P27 family predicted phage terminase small subunit